MHKKCSSDLRGLIAQGVAEDGVIITGHRWRKAVIYTFYTEFALIWRRLRAPVDLLSLTSEAQHEVSDQRPRKWCFRWLSNISLCSCLGCPWVNCFSYSDGLIGKDFLFLQVSLSESQFHSVWTVFSCLHHFPPLITVFWYSPHLYLYFSSLVCVHCCQILSVVDVWYSTLYVDLLNTALFPSSLCLCVCSSNIVHDISSALLRGFGLRRIGVRTVYYKRDEYPKRMSLHSRFIPDVVLN